MLVDIAYVGNKASDLLLIGNLNQAAPNNSAGTIALAARRPSAFGDITEVFNGGKSRYDALQMKWEWRKGADLNLLSALTLSKAKDNASQSLENANGNSPSAQDIHNISADYGTSGYHQPYNSTTSVVWMVPLGRGKAWGDWQVSAINVVTPGEPVTFVYTPAAAFQVSGHHERLRGCEQLPAERDVRPGRHEVRHGMVQPGLRDDSDRSQPAVRQRHAQQRARAELLDRGFSLSKQVALAGAAKVQFRLEAFNLFNRVNYTAPSGNRSTAAFGTITRPTTRARCSSG
jgi:hypothetical protein